MRKIDVSKAVAFATGIDHNDVEHTIDATISIIKKAVRNGEQVHFRGFGSFRVVQRKQKIARDIKKGKPLIVPAQKKVKFFPSKNYFKIPQ